MIWKGFRFGMILQLAVGPMCLMVFNTAATYGFLMGFSLVLAIALVDLIFILLAGIGVAAIINRENMKRIIKLFGCMVLLLFGANTIAGAFHYALLPEISLLSNIEGKSIFIQGLLLTASNPLTIIFWSGVFSTQVIENQYNKSQLVYFGAGCVLSTLCFLTLIDALGSVISGFLSQTVIQMLNVLIGIVIIFFGIRLLLKKI